MKKLIIYIAILIFLISCGNTKIAGQEKADIYNNNDFYISYDIENDVYKCEFKNEDKIYYIKSKNVEIKVLPYTKFSEYELYVEDEKAYKLIIYIGVDD